MKGIALGERFITKHKNTREEIKMKSTHTNFKPINQYEKAEMLKILEEEQGTEEQCGNILILKDKEETRIFTIVKEEIITE